MAIFISNQRKKGYRVKMNLTVFIQALKERRFKILRFKFSMTSHLHSVFPGKVSNGGLAFLFYSNFHI